MHFNDGGIGYSFFLIINHKPILHLHDDKKMVNVVPESIGNSQAAYNKITDHQVGKKLRIKFPFSFKKGTTAHFN